VERTEKIGNKIVIEPMDKNIKKSAAEKALMFPTKNDIKEPAIRVNKPL
jgi:hypothetical protein